MAKHYGQPLSEIRRLRLRELNALIDAITEDAAATREQPSDDAAAPPPPGERRTSSFGRRPTIQ